MKYKIKYEDRKRGDYAGELPARYSSEKEAQQSADAANEAIPMIYHWVVSDDETIDKCTAK